MFGVKSWKQRVRKPQPKRLRKAKLRALAAIEKLEDRVLLYTTSGNAWPNKQLVTISFMPDGTDLGGATSNLVSTFNTKFGSAAAWQNQILKAAQVWAQQTDLNFAVVSDNGAATGSGNHQQGDPNFGDIRIGGFNFGTSSLAQAYLPPPVNNYSVAGDIQFNTGAVFNVGSQHDLFTVALHEFGHALALYHSSTAAATMYPTYNGIDIALNADDISGIKNIYGANAARKADSYDLAASNGTTSAASVVTSLINTTTKTAVINNLDLTTNSDLDFFKFVVPSGSSTTLKATVVTQGLSLMNPKVEILNSAGTVKATATADATDFDGTSLTATFTGIAAGQTYFVKVSSANSVAAFKTGKYALVLNMGTGANPAVTTSSQQIANGTPLSSGGGVAVSLGAQTLANTATSGIQQSGDRAVASDVLGNYVVTWASQNQDGSGWGVYAQRFSSGGTPLGNEIKVNTTTLGDQVDPAVAMDTLGNFVISWTGQDGSGTGIFARHFSFLLGISLTGEFRVNTTTIGDQTGSSAAMDALGNFVITWTSHGQDGSGAGIYARKFLLLLGLPVGSEFRVNTTTAGDQTDSIVVMNRLTQEMVVTWQSAGQDGSGAGIYSQRLKPNGTRDGAEFRINTTTSGDQTDPAIAINRFTGDWIVAWTSAAQDGDGLGIYARRYNKSGVAQGMEFQVNTTTSGNQSDSSVALDSGGNILATWSSFSATNGWQVYGQQFTNTGVKQEMEFVVNNHTAGDQNRASVEIDFLGQVIVVWSGNGLQDGSGVYFQRYRTDLHPLEAEGHGHHHDNDHDDAPDDAAFAAGLPRGQLDQSHRDHDEVNPDSGAGSDRWRDHLETPRRSHQPELPANSESSPPVSRRPVEATELAELSEKIDALFGSDAWLNGRHYGSR